LRELVDLERQLLALLHASNCTLRMVQTTSEGSVWTYVLPNGRTETASLSLDAIDKEAVRPKKPRAFWLPAKRCGRDTPRANCPCKWDWDKLASKQCCAGPDVPADRPAAAKAQAG
jgi:hypothetical protein